MPDIVVPAEGRQMAKKIGAVMYYETSVTVPYGVEYLFLNAIRAVFVHKRKRQVLRKFKKQVSNPLLQAPHLPPKPSPPEVVQHDVPPPATCNILDLNVCLLK